MLVTGSSGFLAQHIIPALLTKGYNVVGVDKRPEIVPANKFIQADVRDLGFRDLMNVDYVIHLAFVTNIPNSVRHPKETTNDNINMTVHLLEVCREAGIQKFVFPSTASLYSYNPTPWKENMTVFPIEPYSWQKLSCEYACKMYSRVYNLPTVIFRFFQVFGEFQREDTALAAFLKFKREGKSITLTKTTAQSAFKSGQRDFIYAGDLAKAVIIAIESNKTGKGEIFNVSSGKVHTMEEIANVIGNNVEWIPRREYEVERHEGSIDKIRKLGWSPQVDVLDWLKGQISTDG